MLPDRPNIMIETPPRPAAPNTGSLALDVLALLERRRHDIEPVELDRRYIDQPVRGWWERAAAILRAEFADVRIDVQTNEANPGELMVVAQRGPTLGGGLDTLELVAVRCCGVERKIDVKAVSHAAKERAIAALADRAAK